MNKISFIKKYGLPIGFWMLFESIAVVLWKVQNNIFFLFNFSYIGTSLAVAMLLFVNKKKNYITLLRVKCDKDKCVSCNKCRKICPMNVDMINNSRKRKNGTECILCMECINECPKKALHF